MWHFSMEHTLYGHTLAGADTESLEDGLGFRGPAPIQVMLHSRSVGQRFTPGAHVEQWCAKNPETHPDAA